MIKKNIIIISLSALIIASQALFGFAEGENSDEAIQADVQYTADTERDPFESYLPSEIVVGEQTQTQGATPLDLSKFVIQGISMHVSRPTAIINNKVIKVGDEIDSAKITEIKEEGITVIYQGQIFIIPSPSSKIKQQKIKDD